MITIDCSFDDGSIYDLKVVQLLDEHEIDAATFYIPVNWAKNLAQKGIEALTPSQVFDIAYKFELGSHGVDHLLLTRYPVEDQRREIFDSKDYWEMQGFKVDKFCYPRGYYTQDIKDLVKEAGYKSARTVAVGELRPTQDPYEVATTVHVGLDRKEYGTDWLDYATQKLDEAIRRAETEEIHYHFWGHSEEINRLDQWDRFDEFLGILNENTSA